MVEFHAPTSAARGWFFMPSASSGKRLLLPRSSLPCMVDFLAIFTFPLLGSLLCQNTESLAKNLYFWSLLSLFSILLTASHKGYSARSADQIKAQAGLAANCFLATSLGMLTLAVILGHPNILSRHWVGFDLFVTPFLLIIARTFLAPKLAAVSHRPEEASTLIVCYNSCPQDLDKALAAKNLSQQIENTLYLAASSDARHHHDWPILPDLGTIRTKLRDRSILDVIFVYHPALDGCKSGINHALWEEILAYPARIWLAFDVASSLPSMLREKSGGCRLIPVVTDEFLNSNNLRKRLFDIVTSCILLLLAAPLMAICAFAVCATSSGPIMFRQLRTGAQGHQFEVLKFRTMIHNPDQPFTQTRRDDPRVTNIGRVLRRTSLDELPQLINVIRGDMSLVGPRPHAPETQIEGMSFENALQLYQIRHRVKPGITGLAQIRGLRGAIPALQHLEQRLASDLEYIQSWSIWLDLSILVQTIPAVLMQTNAW
jgi:exopolysaccharide biosynthesis polyprenyl glycosylphosphotransferase